MLLDGKLDDLKIRKRVKNLVGAKTAQNNVMNMFEFEN